MADSTVTISIGSIFLKMKTSTVVIANPFLSQTKNSSIGKDPSKVGVTSTEPPKTINNFVNACASYLASSYLNSPTDKVTLTFSPGNSLISQIPTRILWKVEAKGFETTIFLLNQFQVAVAKEMLMCHFSTLYTRWVTIDTEPFKSKVATIKTSGKEAITLALMTNHVVTAEGAFFEVEEHLRQQFPSDAIICPTDIRSLKTAATTLVDKISRGSDPQATVTMLFGRIKEIKLVLTRDKYAEIYLRWGAAIRDLVVEACSLSGWYPRDLNIVIVNGAAATHPLVTDLIQNAAPLARIYPRERSFTMEAVETLKLAYTEGQGPVVIDRPEIVSAIVTAAMKANNLAMKKSAPKRKRRPKKVASTEEETNTDQTPNRDANLTRSLTIKTGINPEKPDPATTSFDLTAEERNAGNVTMYPRVPMCYGPWRYE